ALRKKTDLYGKVLVVGGGNTAIDCARTSLRLGAAEVRLLYRRTRTEMPANEMEIVEAEHEGIQMDFLVAPVRVIASDGRLASLECIRMELGEPDASGRRSPRPVRGSEFKIDCDFVIAAIGQNTKVEELVDGRVSDFLPFGEVLNLTRWRTIQVNEKTFETSVDGVFSGGDVVTGAATAIEAIAAGRKAAHAIDTYIRTGKAQPEPVEFCSRKDAFRRVTIEDLRDGSRYARRPMPVLSAEERRKSFAEVEQGYTTEDVRRESHRCLECGCVALFDCDLRRHATDYGVDISSFIGEAKVYFPDRSHPLIELDPNKCILCGRCVRVCSEVVGVAAYGFINRGFNTVVRPALGGSLLDTDCVSCGLCIGTCPTGAIAGKIPLDKPGPWPSRSTPTVCHYCGVGCRLQYDAFGNSLVKVSRFDGDCPTLGNHCRKGRFGFNYVMAEDRLLRGQIRAGRELQDASVDEAIRYAAMRLKELTRRYSGSEIAVFVSPRLTNEEAYLAQKLARVALKTHNVTSLANLVNRETQCPEVVSSATYRDLADAQAVLVVNSSTADEHFVADLLAKRAIRKGAKLIYVGPEENHVSRFAEVFLKCAGGDQMEVLLALLGRYAKLASLSPSEWPALEPLMADRRAASDKAPSGVSPADLDEAAGILHKSILKVIVFNKDYRGTRSARDGRVIAEMSRAIGASVLALREKANMQGILDVGVAPDWLPGYVPVTEEAAVEELEKEWCVVLRDLERPLPDVAEALRRRQIKVAVVLGEDPFGAEGYPREILDGLGAADFILVADLLATATTKIANVVLPLSSPAETGGTFTNSERRVQSLARAIPPRTGMETWEVLCHLGAEMGYRFKMKYANVEEVTAEILRVAPIYRDVTVNGADGEGIWDPARLPMRPVDPEPGDLDERLTPQSTIFLDALEARFGRWFDQEISTAREALWGRMQAAGADSPERS
ncbi:MAG: hypothetical protein FJY88_13050, partial [Candidatus Eisenbacteria bacterium]|nr:hypothetical protein [Candidatus Eisenbacteria bacterium]